jgi:hypothetical protein
MAVGTDMKLDANALRADFPILAQEINGKPLAYLDSAVTAQKPRQMLEAMTQFYETSYANVHRGVYSLAERATEAFEGAREKIARLVNAPSSRELIFTRNATESLNLVAYAWGLTNLGPRDGVGVTELEHHSNFVPWQYVSPMRTGRSTRLTVWSRGHTTTAPSWSSTQPRPRRIARSTCRRSGVTFSPSRRTSSAVRAASARSGAAASCSRLWSRSTSAAT